MEKQIRTAGIVGVETLYHYQPFDADRLADLLTNHRVFCSNPANFNDPWDCKPFFDLDVVDDPAMHQIIAEDFIRNQEGGPHGDPMDEQLRRDPNVAKMFLKRFNDKFCKDFVPSRWAVYCLGKRSDSALMWSHYSRNHTGICLEFTVPGTKFANAWEVEYQEEYPAFIFALSDPVRLLIVKSDVWAYEEEFRLVCPYNTNLPDYPLLLDGSYLPIGPLALKSVIVGCQADHEAIEKLISEHAPTLPIRRAFRSPNKYRLEIGRQKTRDNGRTVGTKIELAKAKTGASETIAPENTTSWKLKITRAKEHFATLQAEIPEWARTSPISITKEKDNEGRHHTVFVEIVKVPPLKRWSLIAGDCVHNLRSALDSLVYGIAIHETGQNPPPDERALQFPIASSPQKFSDQISRIKSLNKGVQSEIERVQPYNSPQREIPPVLELLGILDNADKHRILNVAAVPHSASVEMTYSPDRQTTDVTIHRTAVEGKTEILSFATDPDPDLDYRCGAAIVICVAHPPGPSKSPFSELAMILHLLIDEVERIVNRLESAVGELSGTLNPKLTQTSHFKVEKDGEVKAV